MPNRIIDQTEKVTIDGTESIPGTEQTSTGKTMPKNKRWVFNTIKTWILTGIYGYKKTVLDFTGTETQQYVAARYEKIQDIIMNPKYNTNTIKVGLNPSLDDIVEETTEHCNVVNKYYNNLSAGDRTINITCTDDICDVTIISILTK